MLKKLVFAISLTCLPYSSLFAVQPTLSFFEVGASQIRTEGVEPLEKLKGLAMNVSYEFNQNFYVNAYYINGTDDNTISETSGAPRISVTTELDITETSIGAGYKYVLYETTIVAADLNYINIQADVSLDINLFADVGLSDADVERFEREGSGSASGNGISARLGIHHAFNDYIQVGASIIRRAVKIEDEDTADTAVSLEAVLRVYEQFSVKAYAESGEDDRFGLFARYSF